ncbi:MAG: hypothetical protein LBN97_04490 [Oscillospiraceae bacterium]|jgi:hypothetical protein|nr:hypothetical protein [Oscillospiraceae bacterium]
MNFVVCKQCGKIFEGLPDSLCPRCMMDIDDGFRAVYHFLNSGRLRDANGKDIKKAESMKELCEKTKVPEWIVVKLLREEKLNIKYALEGGLECEVCHKPIAMGEMCDTCKDNLSNQFYTGLQDRKLR